MQLFGVPTFFYYNTMFLYMIAAVCTIVVVVNMLADFFGFDLLGLDFEKYKHMITADPKIDLQSINKQIDEIDNSIKQMEQEIHDLENNKTKLDARVKQLEDQKVVLTNESAKLSTELETVLTEITNQKQEKHKLRDRYRFEIHRILSIIATKIN